MNGLEKGIIKLYIKKGGESRDKIDNRLRMQLI